MRWVGTIPANLAAAGSPQFPHEAFYLRHPRNSWIARWAVGESRNTNPMEKGPRRSRACVQLSRIIAAAICTAARKFLASLS